MAKTEQESRLPDVAGEIEADLEDGKLSRRNFLMMAGLGGFAAVGGMKAYGTLSAKKPVLIGSSGVLLHDPVRCVGCTRCEKACVEFNDGFASQALARIHADHYMTYGFSGPGINGAVSGQGLYGNGKVLVETCKQCPHPVPCAEACPRSAISADSYTGARVVDQTKCIGCGLCRNACPWEMPVINPVTVKATKCFLCNGNPECAHACPTGALKYVPWRDLRQNTPIMHSGMMPVGTTTDCSTCHS